MLPREDIQQLLTEDGHFLVRQSEVNNGEGLKMILSIRWKGKFHHFIINHHLGSFFIEKYRFDSISDLIRFYTKKKRPVTMRTGALLIYGVPKQRWELHHDQIRLGRMIDEGGFGGIYEATVKIDGQAIQAAVKVHKGRALDKEIIKGICNEARIMRRYSHPNIVQLYGVAVGREPIMVVMELVRDGALDSYLVRKGRLLRTSQKVRMCLDAASGLEYLHEMGCIHRDVSARNCLVHNMRIKITDFGLSREITKQEVKYKLKNLKQKLPIRWLAPETLMTATYTTKSDVFSYGILLWEIFMDAAEPYFGMTIAEVNEQVKTGYRMPAPDCMPKAIQQVMCVYCFADDPEVRLSMKKIREYLQDEYGDLQTEITETDT
ncbi:Tyrosine-protein kinase Fps85D [Toxocara canis]|uniref:Tyrosine-protein kinase n=1 Tax=Toxocara canis TaxID=6265 RepID=A0A0B2VND7_TOXCA|nr:Tyrosine-protein kinase Fps85D [Toxocara canis]